MIRWRTTPHTTSAAGSSTSHVGACGISGGSSASVVGRGTRRLEPTRSGHRGDVAGHRTIARTRIRDGCDNLLVRVTDRHVGNVAVQPKRHPEHLLVPQERTALLSLNHNHDGFVLLLVA